MQTTTNGEIHYFSISSRRLPKEHVFEPPDDVDLTLEPSADPGTFPRLALIFCVDVTRQRAMYTLLPNDAVAKVLDAAFLRAGQLRYASGIVSVPVERLSEVDPLPADVRPTFAFSIGRTGSTLLTRLLHALGRPSASEPGLLTQICCLTTQEELLLSERMRRQLVASCVASLSRFLGPTPFIKLPSQCNARAEALLSALPASTAVLMFRNRTDWAISRHRAFRETPCQVANILKEGVAAFETLSRIATSPRVVWYEDLVANPVGTLEAMWPGLDLSSTDIQGKLRAVMAADSQEGTLVAQSIVRLRPIEDGFLRDFDREWRDIRAKEQWSSSARELVERLEKRVASGP